MYRVKKARSWKLQLFTIAASHAASHVIARRVALILEHGPQRELYYFDFTSEDLSSSFTPLYVGGTCIQCFFVHHASTNTHD